MINYSAGGSTTCTFVDGVYRDVKPENCVIGLPGENRLHCIYMLDLGHFARVNEIMAEYFSEPYPARATVEVSGLPLGAEVEVEAVLGL